MGYTLKIGEAVIEYNNEAVSIGCNTVKIDGAPAHGDPTDGTNEKWPSYDAWTSFCNQVGISHVMFNEHNGFVRNGNYCFPLIQDHPGAAPITAAHLEEAEERLAAYKARFPGHIAQYPPLKEGAEPMVKGTGLYSEASYVDDPKYDGNLCRAEWLVFWMRWALENCERPVFVNS
jgi:hypothetical protein